MPFCVMPRTKFVSLHICTYWRSQDTVRRWLVLGRVTTKEDHSRLRMAHKSYIWRVIKFYLLTYLLTYLLKTNAEGNYTSRRKQRPCLESNLCCRWAWLSATHQCIIVHIGIAITHIRSINRSMIVLVLRMWSLWVDLNQEMNLNEGRSDVCCCRLRYD